MPSSAATAGAGVSPGLAPPPGNPRFALFDGMRAIAALSVLLTHASGATNFNSADDVLGPYFARLNVGVAMFFVVSGFLLYRPFAGARLAGTRRPSAGGFFRRRALRILPAYWVLLTVLNLWPGLNGVWSGHWWAYYGLLQNLDSSWILGGIGPAWSLCIEAEFYLALPLIAVGMDRLLAGRDRRTQMRAELAVIWAAALTSLAARTLLHATLPEDTFSYTLPGTLLWFAPGMSLAVLSAAWAGGVPRPRWATAAGRRSWALWLGAFAVLTLATRIGLPRSVVFFRYTETTWFAEHVLYAAAAALVVAPAALSLDPRGLVERLLAHRVAVLVGVISYSLFLVHLPLTTPLLPLQDHLPLPFVGFTLALLAVSVAAATVSYRLVERPFLELKERGGGMGRLAYRGAGTARGLSPWARARARSSPPRR